MSGGNGNGTKTATKSAGRPFQMGPDPRRGVGLKGRSGRTPDEFKAALAELASETVRRGYVTKILRNHEHPQFMSALKWATDRGYGPIAQQHEISGVDGGPIAFTFKIASPQDDSDGDSA